MKKKPSSTTKHTNKTKTTTENTELFLCVSVDSLSGEAGKSDVYFVPALHPFSGYKARYKNTESLINVFLSLVDPIALQVHIESAVKVVVTFIREGNAEITLILLCAL